MIEVLHKENIEEILTYPQDYVDNTQDIALIRVYHSDDITNPTYIMIGQDESGRYYLVVEDNDVSEDYYLENNETLCELYGKLLKEINK